MKVKMAHIKFIIVFISVYLFLGCKQNSTKPIAIPIGHSYSFRTEKAEYLSVEAFNLRKVGKYSEAISLYRKAIAIEPENPKLFFDMSECYANRNEFYETISVLDTAIKLDSLNPSFYNNRGLMHWRLYKEKDAIVDYKKAIALGLQHWVVYSNLSIAYYAIKNEDDACETFKIAKQLGLTTDFIKTDSHLILVQELCK
jgi:Flp pilus assembly protein TadD